MSLVVIESAPSVRRRGILELGKAELETWLAERGEKPLRARQIIRWIVHAGATSFAAMTDLPLALRQALTDTFVPLATSVARHQEASDGTHKLLLALSDGKLIECVLIQDEGRRTACISTQVGCGMGCVFCASGLDGVDRNLTVDEIMEQLIRLRNLAPVGEKAEDAVRLKRLCNEKGSDPFERQRGSDPFSLQSRLTNIVVMGMGEPLANLDALLPALDWASSKHGLGIGARHITISTVGLPAKIRRLAELGKQYHLAVSLHAPTDPLRTKIVPTNDKTGLEDILAAADFFFEKTGRQVTFEYVLLGGLNDDVSHARQLAQLLAGRQAHVNLIPFNEVAGLPYRRPATEALGVFTETLRRHGLSVKVRKRKGSQIDAACGQLRRSALAEA